MNTDTNWQVKTFTDIILNFIPNKTKICDPCDPPWVTKPVKSILIGKIDFIKATKDMDVRDEDAVRLDTSRIEC